MDINAPITRKHLALCRYVDTSRSLKNAIKVRAPTRPGSPHPVAFRHIADYFNLLATWWSMLFVLVEGYSEVKGSSPKIDALLTEDKVSALRIFRNGMFHFQSEPMHDKLTQFLTISGVEKWAEDLQSAFEEYIEELFPEIEKMYTTETDIRQLPRRTD